MDERNGVERSEANRFEFETKMTAYKSHHTADGLRWVIKRFLRFQRHVGVPNRRNELWLMLNFVWLLFIQKLKEHVKGLLANALQST